MDHQQQHHEQHRKEREHEKASAAERERHEMNSPYMLHHRWFLGLGYLLMALVLLVWIFAV